MNQNEKEEGASGSGEQQNEGRLLVRETAVGRRAGRR